MGGKSTDMQVIFNKLSDENKDILILIAKSMKVAQQKISRHSFKLLKGRKTL